MISLLLIAINFLKVIVSKYNKEFCKGFQTNGIYLFADNMSELEENIDDLLGEREYVFKDVTDLKKNDVTNGMQVILLFIILITALFNCVLTVSLCKVGKGKLIEELKL